MKPLTYFEQIIRMPNKADKFDLRLRLVKHAITEGIKPTARLFGVTPILRGSQVAAALSAGTAGGAQ